MKNAFAIQLVVLSLFFVGCGTSTEDSAPISSAVETVGGDFFGDSLDPLQRKDLQRQSLHTLRKVDRGVPLDMHDVVNMSQAQINDEAIIGQIESTNSQFHLTTSDIIQLQRACVSQRVIDAMIRTDNSTCP